MKRFHHILLSFSLLLLIIISFSCDVTVPPVIPRQQKTMTLIKEDSTLSESWIRLQAPANTGRTIKILRDRQIIVANFERRRSDMILDTIVYDASLSPHRAYTYQAYCFENNIAVDSSNTLKIRTMDTTNHNFVWTKLEFGESPTSKLYDVCIVNDTCVYAVGEIYLRDSSGVKETDPYNIVEWNGIKWIPNKITYTPVRTIFAFNSDDVWAGTSAPYHFDGKTWKSHRVQGIFNGYINKIWGTSSNNIYIVGTNGSIAFFNGVSWKKLGSGTTLPINDIWGTENPNTGELEILAVASNTYLNEGRELLRIQGEIVTPLPDSGLSYSLNSIWFEPQKLYLATGDGMYRTGEPYADPVWVKNPWDRVSTFYKNAVRGNSINDIVMVCDYGDIIHYNGLSWKSYYLTTRLSNGIYSRVAIRENLIVAVGDNNGKGVIAMGRKN